jgi:hypothetical protein
MRVDRLDGTVPAPGIFEGVENLHPRGLGGVVFDRGGAKETPILEADRFVFDGAVYSGRQNDRLVPGTAVIS